MRTIAAVVLAFGILALAVPIASSQQSYGNQDDDDFVVLVLKDGRQMRFQMSEVARIEFKTSGFTMARFRFLGRWRVGTGNGETLFITLTPNGEARRSNGNTHGTWTTANGEARITWDDGWRDVIRRAGNGYEKAAFAPGRSFDDRPTNITEAISTDRQPY